MQPYSTFFFSFKTKNVGKNILRHSSIDGTLQPLHLEDGLYFKTIQSLFTTKRWLNEIKHFFHIAI